VDLYESFLRKIDDALYTLPNASTKNSLESLKRIISNKMDG